MSISRAALAAAALTVLTSLAAATPATAQYFGKNKVQYESLDWAVFETPHVRFHYYAQEESLARRLTVVAESICVEYDARFRVQFRRPIPILLYSAHHLFQQSNATPGLITEAVGGLTELVKGRVLLPHNGSWARLVWVTRHELAHAYMLEKLSQVMREHHRTQSYFPPLWFIEGLAEYCGTVWDADGEGLLRDALIGDRAVPLTRSESILGTVLMYKEGQSFLLFLAARYGPEKVFDLLDNWHRADDFETVFRITFGRRLDALDEEWFEGVKQQYYPVVMTAEHARKVARLLTHRGRFNLGPRALPDGHGSADSSARFCYFAADENGIALRLSEPSARGRRERVILRGGRSPSFESFHLFQNRPDASASGLIALSSKHGGRDALYLVDSRSGHVVRKVEFPQLVAVNHPSLAPDDQAVVFSAQDEGGRADLYRLSWPGERLRLERLTSDDFDDVEPDVSPDGRWVIFASDRGERDGHYSIYRLSLEGGTPEPVSYPNRGDDRQPVYSPDGRWIAFRSTRDGTSDLFVRPAEPSREARRVTRLIGPAYDPDWLGDGRALLFCGQDRVEFQAYQIPCNPDSLPVEYEEPSPALPLLASADPGTHGGDPGPTPRERQMRETGRYAAASHEYERRLGLDLVQNGFAFDPGLGAGGGANIALSDVLGNEQIYFTISNSSDRFGDFWDGFEGGVTYFNQAQRLNYGLGIFRLTQIYDVDLDMVRRERRAGIYGVVSYPFNKFTRVEASVMARHANQHLLRNGELQNVDLVSNFLSLVQDNVGWTQMGPSSGTRWILSAGYTRDLTSGAGNYTTALGEIRGYLQPIPQVISATRLQYQASFGRDAQNFYLGGFFSLRGYERRALYGQRILLAQNEVRLPLLRGLVLNLPSTWMFPTVSAAAFADAGWAWGYGTVTQLGDVGTGVYIGGAYFPVIRWDFIWNTPDFHHFAAQPRTEFSIGFLF